MRLGGQWQRTLRRSVEFAGVGLHSGQRVRIRVNPAAADAGIVFRAHVPGREGNVPIQASIKSIDASRSQLCTQLRASDGTWAVSTVEHLMAALSAARVSNACVDVLECGHSANTIEMPIMDGSALPFATAIEHAGMQDLSGSPSSFLKVARPVQVLLEDKAAWLLPMPSVSGTDRQPTPTLHLSVQVNFEHKGLGSRFFRFMLGEDADQNIATFTREIAPARTFTFEDEISWMQANGLALGGSLENAVVFKSLPMGQACAGQDSPVLNSDGLRFEHDEWVRHKLLDCIGDLGLVGLPIHGYFFSTSPGHALTHLLIRELFSDPSNYNVIEQQATD